MVVYGEGRVRVRASTARCAPVPASPAGSLPAASNRTARTAGGRSRRRRSPRTRRSYPRNVYAATKLHQEHLAEAFALEHPGASTVTALRYHNVYGPRMPRDTPYAGVASIFRSAIAARRAARGVRGRRPACATSSTSRDVARANVLALTEPGAGAPAR